MSKSEREARLLQMLIACVFFGLGGWCVIAPGSVIALGTRPEHYNDALLTQVTMGAFGAQALLAGTFVAFSRFTRWTFLAFGVALMPFFVFDWWFYAVTPLFNEFVLIDAAGNALMLALCARGYWLLRAG